MMYIPSLAIVSHYFLKRRALVMTFVASGSSFGSIIHPIMLNNTLNGRLGFANATRANAGLMTGMLLTACVLMRTRLPPSPHQQDLWHMTLKFMKDGPYVAFVGGYAIFGSPSQPRHARTLQVFFFFPGLLLPFVLPSTGCCEAWPE